MWVVAEDHSGNHFLFIKTQEYDRVVQDCLYILHLGFKNSKIDVVLRKIQEFKMLHIKY